MSRPSPESLAYELDWMFMYLDANPIFMHAAETIKELKLENDRLRNDRGFVPPERPSNDPPTWG